MGSKKPETISFKKYIYIGKSKGIFHSTQTIFTYPDFMCSNVIVLNKQDYSLPIQ